MLQDIVQFLSIILLLIITIRVGIIPPLTLIPDMSRLLHYISKELIRWLLNEWRQSNFLSLPPVLEQVKHISHPDL